MPFSLDALFFESALPTDGRMHSIDVRDAAAAFTAATTADVVGEILLIGGDESHLLRQGDVGKALAAARGLTYVLPGGRPGDPDSDADWFVTDWMDTTRSERVAVIPTAQLAVRCAPLPAGGATPCGWRHPSREWCSNAAPATETRQGATPTRGAPSVPRCGSPFPTSATASQCRSGLRLSWRPAATAARPETGRAARQPRSAQRRDRSRL